jgi:cobalt-precorrin 5A hydrolase / cobalt-factor III methyltransferase / precorrin-3B C17-methyltransferase
MTDAPAIVLLGRGGLAAARRIRCALPHSTLHAPRGRLPEATEAVPYDQLTDCLHGLYRAGRPILALCAAGIVIRLLAPLLADKRAEPPVVAIAEDGSVAVPLLGGHRGANRLAKEVASALHGRVAITTAGDVRFGLALDDPPEGFVVRNPEAAKPVMAALLDGSSVALRIEAGHADWLTTGGAPFGAAGDLTVSVTDRDEPGSTDHLVIHPRVLALGVGCERGTAADELVKLALTTLAQHGLARAAIGCLASIDLKADEPAMHALAKALGVPLRLFTTDRLEAEAGRLANPSDVVFAATGCHGVAEGAALAAAGPRGILVAGKTKSKHATCALARAPDPIDPNRVGRPRGRLAIVGLGPGDPRWRTPEAQDLLDDAEHWVGYHGYLDLLGGPPPSKELHGFALGEEGARAAKALDLAAAGRRVALVSSGDAGIYAMAALVLELVERTDRPAWQRIAIEVSPGISALQAAAARAGAPLGHDFCAISLSDLLTPRNVIEQRITAAAAGDFVTVLYNPASRRRREGLSRALALLSAARAADTPVIHARNLGRDAESVELCRLGGFDPSAVDMLSLVIVGARATRLVERPGGTAFVYTPRGYPVTEAVEPA